MKLLEEKKGLILGIANSRSIAAATAQYLSAEGATLGFNYLPDQGERARNRERIEQVTEDMNPSFLQACDVTSDDHMKDLFDTAKEKLGRLDFVIHSIAFAPTADIKCPTIEASRDGFLEAMNISCYSFLKTAALAAPLMDDGGSICAMTYYGGEKVMPGYNLMGLCKAALERAVQYAAHDLGPKQIRVNSISAGPVKTLAASAVGDFKSMFQTYEETAPLGRNIAAEDVAQTAAFLCSDLSRMITGETIHVDGGFHAMGTNPKTRN